jgi:hypothetical protein
MLNIKEAQTELAQKSYNDVQVETAVKWASRACACYQTVVESEPTVKLSWWTQGAEYESEAIEHAALSGDNASALIESLKKEIKPYQEKAFADMEATFGG